MSLNFFIFFSSYFLILLSILGYGYFLLSFEKNNDNLANFGYVGIIGVFFLIIYSYFSNILIPHSKSHNLIIVLLGLISFVYFFNKYFNKFFFKKDLIFLVVVFLILFCSVLIAKNHDDFPYYHFSYTYNLTQDALNFGIGKFNHGFRTPSSIFYLNSLFFLPYVEYYLFNFSAIFILGFSNIIILRKINYFFVSFKFNNINNNNINFINYLSLLIFIFINIFFYRISEHGTDRSAQILILILFVYLLNYFIEVRNFKIDLLFIYSLFGIIISLKAFYFLYFLFFIPLFYFVYSQNKNIIFSLKYFVVNKYFIYFSLLIFFVLFSYFSNTGCLLYPVSFTCFDSVAWSISSEATKQMNNHYELWSKAGLTPLSKVSNPEEYIQGFNWVSNWLNVYFFNKVSDFILGLSFVVLIFWLLFFKEKKNKNFRKNNQFIIITYLLLILIFIEWFYNHPALRYGGYCVITLLIYIPFSIYLGNLKVSYKKFNKITIMLILITVVIFGTRNIGRIIKETNLYNYKPFTETFYTIKDSTFELLRHIEKKKNKNGVFSKSIF